MNIFNDQLNELMTIISRKVNIEIGELECGTMCIDLNTQAKSHAYLTLNDVKTATIHRRYKTADTLNLDQRIEYVIEDLCYIVRDCMHGRTYVGYGWVELMSKYNVSTDF